jgi:hypothetical protein
MAKTWFPSLLANEVDEKKKVASSTAETINTFYADAEASGYVIPG